MKSEKWTETEWQSALGELAGWQVEEGKWLVKQFLLPSFAEAIAYVNRVADAP